MRSGTGDQVELFNGEGRVATCEITNMHRDHVICEIIEEKTDSASLFPITLFQAVPKGGNMDMIIQKSTELGVSEIQPIISQHVIARSGDVKKKQEKWQRVALEACKQCGVNNLAVVHESISFSECLDNFKKKENPFASALVAALSDQSVNLKSYLKENPFKGAIALLVGPEGDFSQGEYQDAFRAGFSPISFGKTILRVETATLYGLSILQHELTELS